MSQPKWKTVYNTDYSRLLEDTTGVYPAELEIAQEYEDEGKTKFQFYRFPLEQQKLVADEEEVGKFFLVPKNYDKKTYPHDISQYEEWFVKDLKSVARSCGMELEELVDLLCSDIPAKRANAYECIGGHHGYDNFECYPQTLTEGQLNKKWRK